MKLTLSISLVVAALSFKTVALPNTYSEPHSFFDKRGIPARFEVTKHETINGIKSTTIENKNISALYVIPDDLKNWPWWCSGDRSYCDAAWAPTVAEGNALAQWLVDRGDADCTIERPQNSKADAYTAFAQANDHAKRLVNATEESLSMSFTGDQNAPPGGGNAYPGAGVGIAPYP
ncbi:hypothetical protein P171DRAFT_440271 [Karstenula rhodostoma CBS 690.94]|uniref:Uncharacterized protein n=1 Tax=Karstenula rhodostoma CBS 690.94 TaxID=1392251 RepID=A0A9P4PSY2_9PLEO|nr:hypothetical protein P171DRAFT_440271 [Karstenula rhodostoma CBS 690.94]